MPNLVALIHQPKLQCRSNHSHLDSKIYPLVELTVGTSECLQIGDVDRLLRLDLRAFSDTASLPIWRLFIVTGEDIRLQGVSITELLRRNYDVPQQSYWFGFVNVVTLFLALDMRLMSSRGTYPLQVPLKLIPSFRPT
jgi:hypothetical protein